MPLTSVIRISLCSKVWVEQAVIPGNRSPISLDPLLSTQQCTHLKERFKERFFSRITRLDFETEQSGGN